MFNAFNTVHYFATGKPVGWVFFHEPYRSLPQKLWDWFDSVGGE